MPAYLSGAKDCAAGGGKSAAGQGTESGVTCHFGPGLAQSGQWILFYFLVIFHGSVRQAVCQTACRSPADTPAGVGGNPPEHGILHHVLSGLNGCGFGDLLAQSARADETQALGSNFCIG